jgi:hypothetical protein
MNGTGRPISGTYVESDSLANVTSYAAFYGNSVDGVAGAYGTLTPNTNANGIQRIEQRDFTTGSVVGCSATDADGIWPSGANTVNPTGGTTAIVITATDASLDPNASTVGGVVTTSDTVCAGSNNDTLMLNGYIGSIVKWQYSSDNFSSDVHDITNTSAMQAYMNLTQTIFYRAVVQNGSCASVNSTNAVIDVLPAPTVSFAPFTSMLCDNGPTLTLTGGSPMGGSYSGTGVSSGIFSPSVAGIGTFVISYTVNDSLCSATDTASIMVSLCTGIKKNETGIIVLYPNPSNGVFAISLIDVDINELTINIDDLRGREVYKEVNKTINGNYNKQLNLEKLPKGIYYMKLTYTGLAGTQGIQTHKLVIQ